MTLELKTERLLLKTPRKEDVSELKSFYVRNASHLAPWETLADSLVLDTLYEEQLQEWRRELVQGKGVRFFLFLRNNPQQLVGSCSFTQIFYGIFQGCYLGYKLDQGMQSQGFMQEALKGAIAYIFQEKGLHRIMANYMPHNHRSARLLKHLGFKIEGYAPQYLFINGRWEDHILTALTNEQWREHS